MTTHRDVQRAAEALQTNLEHALIGVEPAIRLVLVAMFAGGHVLLEEVPGTGKTTLARALAKSLGLSFSRVQCTPDLLPSDVTGLYWFNQREGDFEFRPGPIFAEVVLADEINRATPRTQSALLEAMGESQVTLEGRTHPLPEPFLVVATQNPVELEGTFPLPEAQLDRFLLRVRLGYPSAEAEDAILVRHGPRDAFQDVGTLADLPDFRAIRDVVRAVRVEPVVRGYMLQVARATRDHPSIDLGASPRATLALYHAAQSLAAIEGRDFVRPDDVKSVASAVLAHRIMVSAGLELRGTAAESVVDEILASTPVPVEP